MKVTDERTKWGLEVVLEEGLGDGELTPTVVRSWYLPGPQPPLSAPAHEFTDWVKRRSTFVSAAPALINQYLTALQRAVDSWDAESLLTVLVEITVYFDKVHDLLQNADVEEEDHESVAELLRLDRGLDLAREVDPTQLHANLRQIEEMVEGSLSDVLHLCRLSWRNDVPQMAAATPLEPIRFDDWGPARRRLRDAAKSLVATVRDHPVEQVPPDPLFPQLEEQFARRLRGPGLTRRSRTEIPNRDIFYEFLAHRYAYDPELPVFQEALSASGYSAERSFRFESRTGLSFYIVMPQPILAGQLPPVVVFRGTQLNDLNDIRTDLEFQIGGAHFRAVCEVGLGEMLLGAAADCDGQLPHVTGHSLGGALAQLTAAEWPDRIGAVVTFQAPGITRANRRQADERFAALGSDRRPAVRHYLADDDVVHLAGQLHLPGESVLVTGLHVHRRHEHVWGLQHTELLLAGHAMWDRLDELGLSAIWSPHTLSAFAVLPAHPTEVGAGHEMVRGGIALAVDLVKEIRRRGGGPTTALGSLRSVLAHGLAQDTPSLRRGLAEVAMLLLISARHLAGRQVRAAFGSPTDREALEAEAEWLNEELEARAAQVAAAAATQVTETLLGGEPLDPDPL